MSTDLIYLGDSSWQPLGNPEPSEPPNELPTVRETWIGRSDLTDAFRAGKPIGSGYLGGTIIDNTPRSNQPSYGLDTVELIVARPPNFIVYLADTGLSLKTATKSANVTGTNIIPPSLVPPGVTVPNPIPCTRTVSFYSPETRYRYFSSARPAAARFLGAGWGDVQIQSSRITVQLSSGPLEFGGANAPAAIVSALHMPTIDMRTGGPEGTSIKGTSWFDVTEVWSRVLAGDT